MKYALIGLLVAILGVLIESRLNDQYQLGYQEGVKTALKTNPPSEELEMACVGLWIGEQNRRYWHKEAAR
jgi:hypothetical protein